ncbi:fatty acid synthase alpha subunit Lsd1, partial [Coemansia sp. RSA 2704]
GGELLAIHPDYVLAVLMQSELEEYNQKLEQRSTASFRYWQDALIGRRPFVQIKHQAPFTKHQEQQVYLNPLARTYFDPQAKQYLTTSLTLVSYAVTENLYDLQLRMQPTVKQGLLGNVPFCVVLDKGVVCPGDSATFHIVIDPLPSSSSDGEDTLSVGEATESADASLSDSSTSGMLHSREHRGRQLLRKQSPAHNQHTQPSGAWGYKVRATLVQHTHYIFECSLTPGRYSFRASKNVAHAHLPSIIVPAQATSGAGTHLTLALQIPNK